MPDFTYETYWLCETAQHWETVINGHRVAWEYQRSGPAQYDWTCDCRGFKYRHRCRHVEEAKPQRCGWHQYLDGEEPETRTDGDARERCCPWCHGGVTSERWAV